jgi:hypothetical protein
LKGASSKLRFLGHLLDELVAMAHTLYVLQLYNVHIAKKTSFAYKPCNPSYKEGKSN